MEWKEPPKKRWGNRPPSKWENIAKTLKENPNRWALIGTVTSRSQGYNIAKRYGIKVVVRTDLDGTHNLYAVAEKE